MHDLKVQYIRTPAVNMLELYWYH